MLLYFTLFFTRGSSEDIARRQQAASDSLHPLVPRRYPLMGPHPSGHTAGLQALGLRQAALGSLTSETSHRAGQPGSGSGAPVLPAFHLLTHLFIHLFIHLSILPSF